MVNVPVSGTKASSGPGWLTLQAWGRQDQSFPAGIQGCLTSPSSLCTERDPTQPQPGRVPKAAAVHTMHHFVIALSASRSYLKGPQLAELLPHSELWNRRKRLSILSCLGLQHPMPQQVHLGTWLNNKCSRLCFLFIQPSEPLKSWGRGS